MGDIWDEISVRYEDWYEAPLGKAVDDPGPLFYPVVLAFRTTPLVWLGLLVAILCLFTNLRIHESRRFEMISLLAYACLFAASMSLGAKKFDRYMLPAVVALDVVAAWGLVELGKLEIGSWRLEIGRWPLVIGLLFLLQAGHVLSYHPHYLACYNPLLGGPRLARRVLPMGWGEGMDLAADYLNQKGDAEELVVATSGIPGFAPLFKGRVKGSTERDLATSDYAGIDRLLESLLQQYPGLTLSLPSLRVDVSSVRLLSSLPSRSKTGLTFAPEAGSERMRRRINKPIPTGQMLQVAEQVFERGFRTIKLYFMLGLPGERPEDIEDIADLALAVRAAGRKVHGRRTQVNVSISTFIPKPHTPFQWAALAPLDEIAASQRFLRRRLRGRGFKLSWNDPQETLLEAILSRGDRRLGPVIRRAWESGARFDGWDEWYDWQRWADALTQACPGPASPLQEVHRQREADELFAWEHIASGVRRSHLRREWESSLQERTRPDCRDGCYGCGILTTFGDLWTPEWSCPKPAKA